MLETLVEVKPFMNPYRLSRLPLTVSPVKSATGFWSAG